MTQQNQLVSIIVRTKDRPKLLRNAMRSIASQAYRPMEVVLINDGGCDLPVQELREILGSVSLNYVSLEKNTGRANAGNVAIERAAGDYVGFLDDDDEFYPEHVETLVSFLEQSDYKVAYTDSLMVYRGYDPETREMKEEKSEVVFSEDYSFDKLVFENYIPFMCLLFKKEILTDSGGLNSDFDLYEDWELLIRIGNNYPFYHIRKITARYNQWDVDLQISQRNRDGDFLKKSYLKVLDKHFEKITPGRVHRYVSDYYHTKNRLKELGSQCELLNGRIHSLETAMTEMVAAKDRQIAAKDQQIAAKDQQIMERDGQIAAKDKQIMERDGQIAAIESALHAKDDYIQSIQSGHGWKLLTRYFKLRDRLMPAGTRRRLLVKLLIKSVSHPKNVFVNLNKTNIKKFSYYLFASDPLTVEKKVDQKLSYGASGQGSYAGVRDGQDLTLKADGRNYFNFLFKMKAGKGGDYVPLLYPKLTATDIKLIAFYLPQFHPIPENDDWWGKGFTEWTNVTRAVPQFIGHYQPRLPGELGFYDLRLHEVQRRQAELAKNFGIYGFCFHFYWFRGKTLLETPVRNFAEHVDFPFCINWANENWTRRWDGEENEILISQRHSPEDDIAFIEHVSMYLKRANYIRINSRPLLIIYRPALLPNPKATAERWREWCRRNDVGEIYLAAAHSFEHVDPRDIGFDAALEFAPNTFPMKDISSRFDIVNPYFKGLIFDYGNAVEISRNCARPPYKKFRGIFPTWDNESRKPGRGTVIVNSSPVIYREWLRTLCDYTVKNFDPEERLIFVNAWNEWAESAYLEPDQRYGYAYLQATAEALAPLPEGPSNPPGRWKILFVSHDACRGGAQVVLLNVISWFKEHTLADIRILCLSDGELLPLFRKLADTRVLRELRNKRMSEDELVRNLRNFCGGPPDLIYCNSVASGREYGLLSALNTPIITHFHELEMSVRRYASDCIDDVLKHTEHFIAISEAVRENLVKNHGVDEAIISTVYSSIAPDNSIGIADDEERRKIRNRLGLKSNKFLVFGCGLGMVFRKGADLFMEVARILRNRGYENFHFYWIGDLDRNERDDRYGLWADHLTAMKEEGLDKYVTFLGLKDEPRKYMRSGDVFLLSSREEPVGLVGLEAAECGLPVICFAQAGGMPDFVGTDAGFVVNYEDVQSMAGKVEVLIGDEVLRRRLGATAREKVLSRFTVDYTAPAILSACRVAAQKKPAVSVIVPNYNHARYLKKRLDSIFTQTFKDFEVILLDDASTDDSMEVLNEYAGYAGVRTVRNEKNSGSPFRQWLMGIDMVQADIIWIAESDDMCESRFLETLLHSFENPEVKLAYSNSSVMDEHDRVTWNYEDGEYLSSLSKTKWKKSYLATAEQEINDGLGVKDTILNISAVLFRRFTFTEELRSALEGMHIAGDWYFIVNAIKDGKVYYEAAKLNSHRRHSESVIGKAVSEKKMEDFFREFCMVQRFIFENYRLDETFYRKWEDYLRNQWDDFYPGRPFEELQAYYPFDEMREKVLLSGRSSVAFLPKT